MTALDDAPQQLDGPPPPLPPRPRPSLSPFGWGTPEEEEETSPGEETSPQQLPEQGAPSPGEDDWQTDEDSESDESSGTSSPASFADTRPTQPVSKAQLRKTAATAVMIGGGMAHTVGAKSEEAKAIGLYLADDDDAQAIGHPLADIMHRRGDVIGGKLSPDANSALQAFMGLAGYLTKQVTKMGAIREHQTAAAGQQVQQ